MNKKKKNLFIKKRKKIVSLFEGIYLGVFVYSLMVFSLGMVITRKYDYYYRFVPVSDLSSYYYIFENEQSDPLLLSEYKGTDPVDIMQKVMNSAPSDSGDILRNGTEVEFFNHVKNGGNVTCAGIAELYLYALRLNGFIARKLFVVKDIGNDFATHTIIEVLVDGNWIIYDPTFNVSFRKDEKLIGAQDIYNALIDGSYKDIETIFYGEVAYPARIEMYPIDYFYHFKNIILITPYQLKGNFVLRNTILFPLRYWYGPTIYYLISEGFEQKYLQILDWLYFVLIVVLPCLLFSLLCMPLILFIIKKLKFSNSDSLDPS